MKKTEPKLQKLKTSICEYGGCDLNKLQTEEKKLKNIEQYRKERKQSLLEQLQEQKMKLKPTEKQQKREIAPSPLEKVVMSRRPYFAYSDDEQDFSDYEQDWETSGSGITNEAEKLIDQLHLSLGSIKAGNSSIKLKKQVLSLLDSLVELGTIDKKQKKKIITNYISQ